MPVIGTFQAVKDGYAGSIRTLMLNGRVRILANDRKNSDGAPDFRISLGTSEIGGVVVTKIEKKSAMTRRVVLGFA